MKKVLLVAEIIFLVLILPRIFQDIPIIDSLFHPSLGNLEIEIIGSGVMALIIGLFLFTYEENVRKKQNTERSKRYFNKIIIPSIKRAFQRSPSGLNRESEINNKAYFDNSSINNIHDAIDVYLSEIHEYIDYNKNDLLAKQLINYHEHAEDAYIKSEELDILLRSMAFMVNILPNNSQGVLYLKALRYAKFPKKELQVLLPMYKHDEDFFEKYFKNPENDLKMSYKRKFVKLDPEVKKIIKELKKESEKIKELLDK